MARLAGSASLKSVRVGVFLGKSISRQSFEPSVDFLFSKAKVFPEFLVRNPPLASRAGVLIDPRFGNAEQRGNIVNSQDAYVFGGHTGLRKMEAFLRVHDSLLP